MTTLANTRPTTWRALFAALAVSLLVALVSPTATHAAEVDPPATGDSVLVVTPHPGGDVIMAGGITSALPSYAAGAGVTIAYMTNGDETGIPAGVTGQEESVAAQALLGRAEADLIFMGYPDGVLANVWTTLAPASYATAPSGATATYATHGLGLTDWFDYRMGEPADEHAPYNKEAMIADMEALIDQRRPAQIFTASEENLNTDYATTYLVVKTALDQVVAANPGYGAVIHTAVVWHPDIALHSTWPQDIDPANDIVEDTTLTVPPTTSLADVGLIWDDREQFVVPTAMQEPLMANNPKMQAIDEHQELGGIGGVLARFAHRDEIFWPEYVNYPVLSIGDVAVTEGGDAVFTVSRTGALNVAVSVTATTSDGTAAATSDYTATTSAVDLAVGAASATFTVPTSADDVDELDETFTVTLSAPTNNATLAADPTGEGTITDDDTAGVTINDDDGLSVIEGGASDSYSVVLDSEPTADVVITATPDAQTTVAPLSLTFTAANWNAPQTFAVTGVLDAADEDDPHEGVITHSAASVDLGYNVITVASATADVLDPTGLVVSVTGPSTGATGLAADYTATVTSGGNGTVTFAWTVTRGTETVATGTGHTLSFTPTLGGAHTVTVVPTDSVGTHGAVSVNLNVFSDVADSIFVSDIIWLADNGITKGCNPPVNDKFCPTDNVTRGQMAAFLVRFLGLTDDGGGNTFTDDDGSIFEADIAKLAAAGITKGCNPPDNTEFCPNDNVTRGQMAAFLVRALGLTDDGGGNTFTDDDGSIFEHDIAKLAAAGITKGCNPPDNTRFCPNANVTREQMAAFIRRADASNG